MAEKNRISVKYNSPNPLFEEWLTDWYNQAKQRNSKMQYTFNAALQTLKKYPLPLATAKDGIILKGFGNKICDMLDKKLKEYKEKNKNLPPLQEVVKKNTPKKKTPNIRTPTTPRDYKPVKGTGSYSILISLLKKSQELNYSGSVTKAEIIEHAKHICNTSFTKAEPGTFYTAWSSMSTLVTKGLVIKNGSPPKFQLSDAGELLAIQLFQEDENSVPDTTALRRVENINNIMKPDIATEINNFSQASIPSTSKSNPDFLEENSSSQSQTSSHAETVIFQPGKFDIILLVDTQETAGGTKNPLNDETIFELNKYQIKYEVRHLKIGDFTWICRERETKQELILPYIVERKRMDDLGHSIKDGRFHEQKFRLKQCGVQNLIYIVESYGSNIRTCLPLSSLLQGATNTLVQDNFQVKFTGHLRHSIQYLSGITLMLTHIYEQKTLVSCAKENLENTNVMDDLIPLMTFKEFNKGASKNKQFKVKEIFVRQLLQLNGVSVEKALAIVDKYPSPKLLKMGYDALNSSQGEKLLANITFGPLKKCIGPVISRNIYQLYTLDHLS